MGFTSSDEEYAATPLDIVEDLVVACDWNFSRHGNGELLASIEGKMGVCDLCFRWDASMEALFFACHTDCAVPEGLTSEVEQLLLTLNSELWLGHFDMPNREGVPAFRHTIPMRGTQEFTVHQLEDMVSTALYECERLAMAMTLLASEDLAKHKAIPLALMDPVGEA